MAPNDTPPDDRLRKAEDVEADTAEFNAEDWSALARQWKDNRADQEHWRNRLGDEHVSTRGEDDDTAPVWHESLKRAERVPRRAPEPKPVRDNLPSAGQNLSVALARRETTQTLALANCPVIDIDPNIGLMLMMGLTDKLTMRQHVTTEEQKLKQGEQHADYTQFMNAMNRARAKQDDDGNEKEPSTQMTIRLRFPNTQRGGKTFNKTLGAVEQGNCLEIPVIIDIRPENCKEWKADELSFDEKENTDKAARTQASDKLAMQLGFADARSMQNSRPLALNNFWLRNNEILAQNSKRYLAERYAEKKHLEDEIAVERKMVAEYKEKLDKPLPSKEELDAAEERSKAAKEAADLLSSIKRGLQAELDKEGQKIPTGGGSSANPEHEATKKQITKIRNDLRVANRMLKEETDKIREVKDLTRDAIMKKRDAWQTIIAYKEEKIARFEQLLTQCKQQIVELGTEKPEQRKYAETDRNPNLITVKVLAADPVSYNRLAAESTERSPVIPRDVEKLYSTTYKRVTEESPNGWLGDAISAKPENHYVRSTNRYFKQMLRDAKALGHHYKDVKAFAEDPTSTLGEHVAQLHENMKSIEQRAAERKSASRG